jgi:FAD/FMN-containing dehydrogenase
MKRSAGSGRRIARGEVGFDAALLGTSFNAQDPGRRPALIVQANNDADVLSAVRQARDLGLKIGICSGGHSWAQNHIRDGGMLIDLSRLNGISINAAEGIATIGPGCLAGELNAALAKQHLFFRWPTPIQWVWAGSCFKAVLVGTVALRASRARALSALMSC